VSVVSLQKRKFGGWANVFDQAHSLTEPIAILLELTAGLKEFEFGWKISPKRVGGFKNRIMKHQNTFLQAKAVFFSHSV